MTEHPSPVDRLEARLDAQAARIDELYRLLQASPDLRRIALHLAEVKAYKNDMVELRYEVRGDRGESRSAT